MLAKYISPQQAAAMAGVTVPTIHNRINSGQYKGVLREGPRKVRIPVENFEEGSRVITTIQKAYKDTNKILDAAIGNGHLEKAAALRTVAAHIEALWDDPTKPVLLETMRSLSAATTAQPVAEYYDDIAKIITNLGA